MAEDGGKKLWGVATNVRYVSGYSPLEGNFTTHLHSPHSPHQPSPSIRRKLKTRSESSKDLERRSELVRSKTRDESEFVGMDRACSDNLVITAGDLCESMEELREQARQLSMLNGSLTDDLKAVEGELALYKERLLRERRRHPVPVFTSAPDISDCSGNQSKNIRRTSALKGKPMSTRMQILWDISSGLSAMQRIST